MGLPALTPASTCVTPTPRLAVTWMADCTLLKLSAILMKAPPWMGSPQHPPTVIWTGAWGACRGVAATERTVKAAAKSTVRRPKRPLIEDRNIEDISLRNGKRSPVKHRCVVPRLLSCRSARCRRPGPGPSPAGRVWLLSCHLLLAH